MSADPVHLSVVVPAYNEAARIGDTVARLRKVLEAEGGLELIVVDDGSTDGTAAAARAAGADRVLVHPRNRGKGAAVRNGVLAATGSYVVFTDADLAYAPEQIPMLVEQLAEGADVVIGSRSHPESRTIVPASRLRVWGSRLINLVTRLVLRRRYGDTQSGFKGFRRDAARRVFERTRLDRMGFDIEVLHLVELEDLSLVEVPVQVANSPTSSVHVVRDGVTLLVDVARVWWWSRLGVYSDRGAHSR